MKMLFLFVVTLLVPLAGNSAKNSCHEFVKAKSLNNSSTIMTYSKQLKKHGVDFLMFKLSLEELTAIEEAYINGADDVGIGFHQPKNISERYLNKLFPISNKLHSKVWAHDMLGNGSDFISNGVRSIGIKYWKVVALFPVEILDKIDFRIVQEKNSFPIGRKNIEYDSKNSSREDFEKFSELVGNYQPSSQKGEYSSYFSFSIIPGESISMHNAAILWFPAPLVKEMYKDSVIPGFFPGMSDARIPSVGTALNVKISEKQTTGWKTIVPPNERTLDFFNPESGIATWFNVTPNWTEVREALNNYKEKIKPSISNKN